ncbi:HD domain-containing protein [Candidatus Collierbacteria bacterium]|nr:HD domain-containing protein [Candidatus Collierbacteria bacterium]
MKSKLNQLKKFVLDWKRLSGESGYQHNAQHLGKHTEDVLNEVLKNNQYAKLPPDYREIVVLAAFFHDMGKPTGKLGEVVPRLIDHESKSAEIAQSELKKPGAAAEIISKVKLLILHDNLMSEYGRAKLHGEKYIGELPSVTAQHFKYDKYLLTALLILNKADVIAAGRGSGSLGRWGKIKPWVTEYFKACMKEAK